MSAKHAWGENITKKYFFPKLTLKYHKSIICEGNLGVFRRKYRVIQLEENKCFKKTHTMKYTCLLWHETLLERDIPLFPNEDNSDDDDPDVDENEELEIIISFAHLHA